MPDLSRPDWAAIRHAYERTDAALAEICETSGITRRDLDARRKKEAWKRFKPRGLPPGKRPRKSPSSNPPAKPRSRNATRPPPADTAPSTTLPRTAPAATPTHRRRLVNRLVAAISLKLEQLERRMNSDLSRGHNDAATATDHERETRAIGALIDNLGKLTEMQTEFDRPAAKPGAPADPAGDADTVRRELAQRLAKLVGAAAQRT